jgi:hypothetical protein
LALLLDDADVEVRRKAAELLFELAGADQAAALRLAMSREEDSRVRALVALTLTRLGEGAPLVVDLLRGPDRELKRSAALVLAQQGNELGEEELIRWFSDVEHRPQPAAEAILDALGRIRSEAAVGPLLAQLDDVRLRPAIARALGKIGVKEARGPLALALRNERFHSAREPLAEALLALGGKAELVLPLRHFLAVPDPMAKGLDLALRAGILQDVGGPSAHDLHRLRSLESTGLRLSLVVPPLPRGEAPLDPPGQLLVLVRSRAGQGGQLMVQPGVMEWGKRRKFSRQPQIDPAQAIVLPWADQPTGLGAAGTFVQMAVPLPSRFGVVPGHPLALELYATGDLEISALAVVARRVELPPPPPQPWVKADAP